ncbi:MAG: hypothetical protein ABEJ78_10650 [Haloferacaceae archaeon]
MRRRAFLTSLALVPLAGCSNGSPGSSTDTASPTATSTPPATTSTAGETPTETFPFELVRIDARDTVQLNVPFGFAISVRNTGSQARTFRSKLSMKVGDGTWQSVDGEIRFDVPAGEVRTWQTPARRAGYLQTYRYRLEAFDATWTTEIVPKRLDFGLSYTTPTGLSLNVLGVAFEKRYSGSDGTATAGGDASAPTAPDGHVWAVFPVTARNRAESPQSTPAPDEFVLSIDGETYRPTSADVSGNPYRRVTLDPETSRRGELVYAVPEGTSANDVEVTWGASLQRGDVKVTWDK